MDRNQQMNQGVLYSAGARTPLVATDRIMLLLFVEILSVPTY